MCRDFEDIQLINNQARSKQSWLYVSFWMCVKHCFCNINIVTFQGRGRDGKFRSTLESGTEKRRFSVLLLITWCHQTDLPKSKLNTELYIFCCTGSQKCTKLHRSAPTLSSPPSSLSLAVVQPSQFSRASAAAVTIYQILDHPRYQQNYTVGHKKTPKYFCA